MGADTFGQPLNRSIERIRSEFPGLAADVAPLDGAAGTMAPAAVIGAVGEAMRLSMANAHGSFAASARTDETVAAARRAVADLLGGDPGGVIFGPNMTTLTFHMADTLSCAWQPGDEVIVTSLDHDANIRPWALAAARRGVTVRVAEFDPASGELAPDAFDELLSERTRVVAVTAASNAIGTKPDVRAIAERAHAAGALVYVDGVHATPHGPIDLGELGADLYAFSTYKLFGPHLGVVCGAPGLLATLRPAKLAPSPDSVPDRFERGTPPFELLAGATAAIDWIAGLTDASGGRRGRILAAMGAIEAHLERLLAQALAGLEAVTGVRLLGDARRRTPTISFVIAGHDPADVAARLGDAGIWVWNGDNYAYELMKRFGLDRSGGAVRASLVLYNDAGDVQRLLEAVSEIARG